MTDELPRNAHGHVDEHAAQRKAEMEREREEQIRKEQWERQQHAHRPPGPASPPRLSAAAEAAAKRRAKILARGADRMRLVTGGMDPDDLDRTIASQAKRSSGPLDPHAPLPHVPTLDAAAIPDSQSAPLNAPAVRSSTVSPLAVDQARTVGPPSAQDPDSPVLLQSYASNTPTVTELANTFSAFKQQQQLSASRSRQRRLARCSAFLCGLLHVLYRTEALPKLSDAILLQIPGGAEWMAMTLFITLHALLFTSFALSRRSMRATVCTLVKPLTSCQSYG